MTRPRKKRKVLLIEPDYSNKFPPIGLMKISTYYKNLGNWDVTFYKGNLRTLVLETITDKCVDMFAKIDPDTDWSIKKDKIFEYIKTRKSTLIAETGIYNSEYAILLESKLMEYKDYWWKGEWKKHPEWDRVGVTTLFTFYWDKTIATIEFAKLLCKDWRHNLMVGGVLASIQPKEIEKATGIKPHVGILRPGDIDKGDKQFIDNLPLDYSILDEVDYQYSMSNAFYGYMSRGCIRHCAFCAVWTLEPDYVPYIPLTPRISKTREEFGDQKDLLLMDNNVLASEHFEEIIQEIIDCGFGKGEKYTQPDPMALSARNLLNGVNDKAYIRRLQNVIMDFYTSLTNKDDSYEVYKIIDKNHIRHRLTSKKENLLKAYEELKPIWQKHFHPSVKQRHVDFNQGVDARLFTEQKARLLASIAIKPLRIAFDDIKTRPAYERAIRWSVLAGIKDFSNYLLYNFRDEPIDLYRRLLINVRLCDELNVNIYSFPMKYHPLRKGKEIDNDYSHNRDYIGLHWNRKYIRAIQAILNSTKGKVGRGQSFFFEAFGHSEEEFLELLEMPETFIIYRFFFKWLDKIGEKGTSHWRGAWKICKENVSEEEWRNLLDVIHRNEFTAEERSLFCNPYILELLDYYTNYRKDIITPGTKLFELKQEFNTLTTQNK
ncbi:MAG: hypothetical protein SO365_04215 [Prevotella sp.]|nr:hypothetical protein [Bacteroidales bacterium]MCI7652904.1 hypothetical protein [Bacteroidales bacterium]MDY4705578.1 hypothetical protein [Prevotella sp.]MDY4952584.1 hypothetical protein [Prevotella sp.]